MSATEHHPSCRESDKDLVWHCSQCGLNEPATDVETKLAEARQAVELAAICLKFRDL